VTRTLTPASGVGDAELMERVQADDPDAFGALFDRFKVRAYRVAYAIAHDSARAEDIVQDAFLSIWRKRASYQPKRGSVTGWLMGVVRNRAIDFTRNNGRHDRRRADEEQIDQRLQTAALSIEQTTTERDEAARLRDVLRQLPAAQREVIALAYFGELTNTEIATELSLPLGTVKGRMRLGMEKLRAGPRP
jgi:RNA polymerase sigma-70 factor, ECF subfamily